MGRSVVENTISTYFTRGRRVNANEIRHVDTGAPPKLCVIGVTAGFTGQPPKVVPKIYEHCAGHTVNRTYYVHDRPILIILGLTCTTRLIRV